MAERVSNQSHHSQQWIQNHPNVRGNDGGDDDKKKHHTLVQWLKNHPKAHPGLHDAYKHYKKVDPKGSFHQWLGKNRPHLANVAQDILHPNQGGGHGGGNGNGGGGQGGGHGGHGGGGGGGGNGGGGHGGGHGGGGPGGGGHGGGGLGLAAQALVDMFNTYGLTGLADEVIKWAKDGVTGSELLLNLRESKAYQKRFPGMEAMTKAGYNAISEAQYLELEDGYHRALETAGLPAGFYDGPDDFVNYMANGLDYTELYDRAVNAVTLAKQSDPTKRDLLRKLYGVGDGDIAAHFLDPKRAKPLLDKQLQVVDIAAAARHAGVGGAFEADRFERLQEGGVTGDQAAQGYSSIASSFQTLNGLADVYGTDYTLTDAEDATFFGDKEAQRKQRTIVGREQAAFSGRSGYTATEDASAGTY